MQSTAKEGDHDAGADAADAGSGDESEGDNFGGDVGATRVRTQLCIKGTCA